MNQPVPKSSAMLTTDSRLNGRRLASGRKNGFFHELIRNRILFLMLLPTLIFSSLTLTFLKIAQSVMFLPYFASVRELYITFDNIGFARSIFCKSREGIVQHHTANVRNPDFKRLVP
ncbi:UNVERIFIED_CONTAM: ABC-type polysaccharide transport system permease subunit [Paenibacillus sp. PvR008]